MACLFNRILQFCRELMLMFFGFFVFLLACSFLVLSVPFYFYRFLISKAFVPLCFGSSENCKLVSINSNALSTEVLGTKRSPRSNIVGNFVIDGHISYEQLYQKIQETWIIQKDKNGRLRYPELQMYIEKWMGFVCFHRDENFNLKNHLKLVTLDETESCLDSETFLLKFNEILLNEPFKEKQSAWNAYLVHNYKIENMCTDSQNLTLLVLQFHHFMIDGYAAFYLVLEQLFGNEIDSILIKPSVKGRSHSLANFCNFVTFPFKLFRELGQVIGWSLKRKTIYHIPDNNKCWKQIFRRSLPVSMHKVKFIKTRFQVSFASVLNSACALALGKMMKKLKTKRGSSTSNLPDNLVFSFTIPKPNHPKTLTVHVLGAAFEAPIKPEMDSIERLQLCEEGARKSATSTLPVLFQFALAMFGSYPSELATLLTKNRYFATGISNLPGPKTWIRWNGGPKIVAYEFECGFMPGVAGVAFMVSSYVDSLRICATAENAVFSHEELQELLECACTEIDNLYELATNLDKSENSFVVDVQ